MPYIYFDFNRDFPTFPDLTRHISTHYESRRAIANTSHIPTFPEFSTTKKEGRDLAVCLVSPPPLFIRDSRRMARFTYVRYLLRTPPEYYHLSFAAFL